MYGNETWPDNRPIEFGIYSRDANKTVIYDPGYDPDSLEYSNIMVPVWQIAPYAGNERAVMFNLHSEINRMHALDNMMKYGVTSLTAILQLVQDKDDIRPSAILFYPVFDSFDKNTSKVPVGSISLVFSWDTFLADVLPDYIKGLVCVLSASTGQTFTYIIRGDDVEFMGEGDLHDPNYDKYQETVQARLLVEGEEEAGEFILYTLTLYPSEEFESLYTSNSPIIYAVGATGIFIFTALIFFLYDKLVEDRQERTSRLARQSGSIVESMFPAGFRDRLYKIQGPTEQRRKSQVSTRSGGSAVAEDNTEFGSSNLSSFNHTPLRPVGRSSVVVRRSSSVVNSTTSKATLKRINVFMKGKTNLFGDNDTDQEQGVLEGEAIAELFHDTSIMFSDIVGFTKWSSEHTPNDVFKLLEQIFWEFDEVAARLNVFKLGTIGDCYIAVTGIPEAVQDHATLLTKFAFEARDKVREVCARLESEGLDTNRLDMRFGIHSGDTTAGILRGAKPRFELFGDTINTASRMESTGLPGKIHLSADTAELIIRDGKSQWLTKRDSMITAKGKGKLQTYWAEPARRVSFTDTQLRDSLARSSKGSSLFDLSEKTDEEESPEEPRKGASEVEAVDGRENEFNRDVDSIQVDFDPEGYDPVFLKLISRESSG